MRVGTYCNRAHSLRRNSDASASYSSSPGAPSRAVERFLNDSFPPVAQLGASRSEEIPAGDRALARPDHAARGRSRTEARPYPRSSIPNRRDARDSQARVPASRRKRAAQRRVDAFVFKTGEGAASRDLHQEHRSHEPNDRPRTTPIMGRRPFPGLARTRASTGRSATPCVRREVILPGVLTS